MMGVDLMRFVKGSGDQKHVGLIETSALYWR